MKRELEVGIDSNRARPRVDRSVIVLASHSGDSSVSGVERVLGFSVLTPERASDRNSGALSIRALETQMRMTKGSEVHSVKRDRGYRKIDDCH